MSEAIIDALRAMQSDLAQVEILSQNIANQDTPGYRAVETAHRPFAELVATPADRATPISGWAESGGQLTATGSELDIAVTNGGFIEVEGARDGRVALVRGGSIEFDDAGNPTINGRPLVIESGSASGSGAEIAVFAQTRSTSEDYHGLCKPQIVTDMSRLELVEPGVYEIDAQFVSSETQQVSVLQGYLEQSNVNSTQVVVQMMELSKHVESVQRTMRALDEMIGSSINELGR